MAILPTAPMLRLLLGALALILVAGPAHRLGLAGFRPMLGLLAVGAVLAVIGAVGTVLAVLSAVRAGGTVPTLAILALLAATPVLASIATLAIAGARLPAIHDISTDLDDPPAFEAVVPLRAGAANPADYDGPAVADRQRHGYPDLGPAYVSVEPAAALAAAARVAEAAGWTVHAVAPTLGRLEATATTRWFGFADDVVVRVRAEGGGSRVDVRSKSRVGRSDLGTNAKRISRFLRDLQAEVGH